MSLHVRHIDPEKSLRIQIRFIREDLLYRHPGPITSPDGKVTLKEGLPIIHAETKGKIFYRAIGPTILDMMTREIVKEKDGTEKAVWALRDLRTLWPEKTDKPRPRRKVGEVHKPVDHPFKVSLASGGKLVGDDGAFVRVTKPTTISISEVAFHLAIGTFGKDDLDATQKKISEIAAKAWMHDLERCLIIWDRIQEGGGRIEEDPALALFRPGAPTSQQVEEYIMRESADLLGHDFKKKMPSRGRGRPSGKGGDSGKVIDLTFRANGEGEAVSCGLRKAYHGLPAGTDISDFDIPILIDILGRLRLDGLDLDASLLEGFLDSRDTDWRERAASSAPTTASTIAHDPYEVLGVSRDATMEDIKAAYRRTMRQYHPDKGVGRLFAQMTIEAYRNIRDQRGEGND